MAQLFTRYRCLLLAVLSLVCCRLPGFAQPGSGASSVVLLRDTAQTYNLGPYWSLLADPRPEAGASPLTLAQVRSARFAARFEPSSEAVPDRNNTGAGYWLRCRLRNDGRAGTSWLLSSQNSAVGPFELFLVAESGGVYHRVIDDEKNRAGSYAVPSHLYNVALPLQPGQEYTLYLRCSSRLFWFDIRERAVLQQAYQERDLRATAYFSVLLGLALYNLLLFFSVRDRGYLYYVLFTFSFGLLQAHMMGYLRRWGLYVLSEIDQMGVEFLLLGGTMASSILLDRSFLDTRRLLPRVDRLLRRLLFLAVVPLLCYALQRLPLGVESWPRLALRAVGFGPTFAALLLCLVLLAVGLYQLWAGFRPARYFMAGWTLLIVAIVYFYLRVLGLVPVSFLTENGVRIASVLEVILLSLGLADRINLARQERQAAQQQAMAALQEKDEVQQKANDALAQRAQELQKAYSELQESLRTTGRLQELDELKTRFFTNISHELRTPLTLIIGPLEELLSGPAELAPATRRERYGLMHRHASRLLELINQLLYIARLEAGQLRLRARRTDLRAFVEQHVAAFDSLAATRGVRLEGAGPGPELPAFIDRDQLEKVLANLLGNALKFTPRGGQVRVGLAAGPEQAVLTVQDSGIGIPPEHLPRIFDRFHQVDDSATRQYEGSGIGLTLVRELVALHHGTVSVASTPGVGSTFTVCLPLGKAHLKPEELAPVDEDGRESGEQSGKSGEQLAPLPTPDAAGREAEDLRPLVLVVDDHAEMRAYVASCLQVEFRVLTVGEGEAGLRLITDTVPDLVVSDLMMPVMNGLALCRHLKSDERTSHIPVVLLTARSGDDSRLAGLELGADDYLTKPFRPRELQARVRNLLRQREQLRQRYSREVTLQPHAISISPVEEVFLNKALAVVEAHFQDAEFDVEVFASELAMSRIQLYRKLKALTDQSPTDFIRTLRLRRAAQLLEAQAGTVADVAYQVGFQSLSYFSRAFREQYGHPPSEHLAAAPGSSREPLSA
ncbi:hypothetical protein GCM10023185_08670 [Hymenobacter saemangeumensis]|uniref:histidine kinase n=1 Tax=Hymenobacter saemangeumensis TaxID=1084522 RepID=A0ABP8I3Q6_9BACT